MPETKTVTLGPIDAMGLRVDVWRPITFRPPDLWAVTVYRRVLTRGGNEGAPEELVTIMGRQDETTPAKLLRRVADLIELGEPVTLDVASYKELVR